MSENKQPQTCYVPKNWVPSDLHKKSGWKNNPVVLHDCTSFVNDEEYIEDESDFAEKLDFVFEFLKQNYHIHTPEELEELKAKWMREAAEKAMEYAIENCSINLNTESEIEVVEIEFDSTDYLDQHYPLPQPINTNEKNRH